MTDHRAIEDALSGLTIGRILYDEPMSRHASLRLGGPADALVTADSEDQLAALVRCLTKNHIPFLPVGNLSNLLVCDGGYRGVLVWMRGLDQLTCAEGEDGNYHLEAQAGVTLAKAVSLAADEELTGLEFCTGIPGSVGGAVWMNAGAFGTEIKDVIAQVTILDGQGEMRVVRREDIPFAYRQSNLPAQTIICKARFVLHKGDETQIRQKMLEIMKWRRDKHPLAYPSAGSVFKNLPGLPAGRLIEDAGLKGQRLGDVQVSKKHANFIVNKGQGTASDMIRLIRLVQEKVRAEKGIELQTEIVVIGEEP